MPSDATNVDQAVMWQWHCAYRNISAGAIQTSIPENTADFMHNCFAGADEPVNPIRTVMSTVLNIFG